MFFVWQTSEIASSFSSLQLLLLQSSFEPSNEEPLYFDRYKSLDQHLSSIRVNKLLSVHNLLHKEELKKTNMINHNVHSKSKSTCPAMLVHRIDIYKQERLLIHCFLKAIVPIRPEERKYSNIGMWPAYAAIWRTVCFLSSISPENSYP